MNEIQKTNKMELPVEVITESVTSVEALPAINNTEIDIQIATAKRYPRSITAFKRQALEMATLDEETAASMFYAMPRAGKQIEGPSVRLAEIVGSAWGNIRYGARGIEIGQTYVTAEGGAFDLEKNNACSVQVKRRIVDSKGRRYSDDMIQVTMNAACSIALRQAIFKIVPFAYVKDVYDKAKQVSVGKGLTIEQQRKRAVEALAKFKLKEADILKIMKKKGLDDLTVDDLINLRGIYTALTDGDTTAAELLQDAETRSVQAPAKSKSEQLADALEKKTDVAPQAPEAEPAADTRTDAHIVRGIPAVLLSGLHKKKPKLTAVFEGGGTDGYTTTNEAVMNSLKDSRDQLLPIAFRWIESDEFGREIVKVLEEPAPAISKA